MKTKKIRNNFKISISNRMVSSAINYKIDEW